MIKTSVAVILVLIVLGIIAFLAYQRWSKRSSGRLDKVLDETPTGTSRLTQAQAKSVIIIDGQPTPIKGKGLLLELKFYHGNKADKVHISPEGEKLREFVIISTTNGGLLIQQPEGEGKSLKFYTYDDQSDHLPIAFSAYLRGSDDHPGPASRFAASEQSSNETMSVLNADWRLTDIVWADLEITDGQVFSISPADGMPRLVMILAQDIKDPTQWILYIEPRSGNLSPMLFVGNQFQPDVEVRAE